MDFLKEIVKEVGGEYTQLAADINDLKHMWTRVRTFLTDSFQAVFLVVYLGIRLLPLLGVFYCKTFFSLAVVKNF